MLQKVVTALAPKGYTFTVVSLTEASRIGGELEQSGTSVIALCGMGGVLLPHRLGRLVRAVREFQPDVIHSWMYHANVLGHAVAGMRRRGGRPALISSIRGCLDIRSVDKLGLRVVRRLDSWLSPRVDAIVFNSRCAADQHAAFGYSMRRAVVIPNCFDTDHFRPRPEEAAGLRARLGWDGGIAIGFVARFDPYKDHRNLLEAARIVVSRDPRCRFILVGPGCESNNRQLSDGIEKYRLAGSVELLGERRDIGAIQSALDIAVSSSVSESFPNAIGEAMACGTPCVVTDVGDCKLLVGDTGLVVPPADPVALADALVRLASLTADQRRDLGDRARARVVAEYGMERIAGRICSLYEECAGPGLREGMAEQ